MSPEPSDPVVYIREGERSGSFPAWRQYLVITDARVVLIDMVPASLGWNFGRVTIQGEADWPDMTRDRIVAWKLANDDRMRVASLDDATRWRLIQLAS